MLKFWKYSAPIFGILFWAVEQRVMPMLTNNWVEKMSTNLAIFCAAWLFGIAWSDLLREGSKFRRWLNHKKVDFKIGKIPDGYVPEENLIWRFDTQDISGIENNEYIKVKGATRHILTVEVTNPTTKEFKNVIVKVEFIDKHLATTKDFYFKIDHLPKKGFDQFRVSTYEISDCCCKGGLMIHKDSKGHSLNWVKMNNNCAQLRICLWADNRVKVCEQPVCIGPVCTPNDWVVTGQKIDLKNENT